MMGAVFDSDALGEFDIENPIAGSWSGSGFTSTVTGDQSSGTLTIVFTNYEDYYDITINGTITVAYSYSGTSGTYTLGGALTFTGADATVNTISFNDVTVSVTGVGTSDSTVTVSGTITVDGVKYVASAFGLEEVFG